MFKSQGAQKCLAQCLTLQIQRCISSWSSCQHSPQLVLKSIRAVMLRRYILAAHCKKLVCLPVVAGTGLPAARWPAVVAAVGGAVAAVAVPSACPACSADRSAPELPDAAAGCKHEQLPRWEAGHSKNWGWSANLNMGPASAVLKCFVVV